MREQRKAWAWGWQPDCNRGLQSSERGTTSTSRLLWPKKLGSRISEYPTSLHTFIWLGMATQRVDWPMSNAIKGYAIARTAKKKNIAILKCLKKIQRVHKVVKQACSEVVCCKDAVLKWLGNCCFCLLYIHQGQAAHQSVSLLSTTYQRRRDNVFGDNGFFCGDRRQRGVSVSRWRVWLRGSREGVNGQSQSSFHWVKPSHRGLKLLHLLS